MSLVGQRSGQGRSLRLRIQEARTEVYMQIAMQMVGVEVCIHIYIYTCVYRYIHR